MQPKNVSGKDKGKVMLYALSTCGWCRKTKELLNQLGVGYCYLDVDLLDPQQKNSAKDQMRDCNPSCSFPTIVVNDDICIKGFDEDRIREVLG